MQKVTFDKNKNSILFNFFNQKHHFIHHAMIVQWMMNYKFKSNGLGYSEKSYVLLIIINSENSYLNPYVFFFFMCVVLFYLLYITEVYSFGRLNSKIKWPQSFLII